jgi:hypothetical protein
VPRHSKRCEPTIFFRIPHTALDNFSTLTFTHDVQQVRETLLRFGNRKVTPHLRCDCCTPERSFFIITMKTETIKVIEGQAIKRSLFEQLHKVKSVGPSDKAIGVAEGYALVIETEHGALGKIHWLDYSSEPQGSEQLPDPATLKERQDFWQQCPQLFVI